MSCVILLGQRKKCETRNRFKKRKQFLGILLCVQQQVYGEHDCIGGRPGNLSKKIRSKWTFNTDFQVSFSQKSVKYNGFSRDAN